MSASPQISVLVSTFQRPHHLKRSLVSLAHQQQVDGQFEVIVTDDGSTDETPQVVEEFSRSANFPICFTTHPHEDFQLARCRNSGVRISAAPYLLFTDGDCIFPPDHLYRHLQARRSGVVRAGDCYRLDSETSDRIDEQSIASGAFVGWVPRAEEQRLRKSHRKALFYQLLRHPRKPKLIGNNIAIQRDLLERINGFDEQFQGWGCEDDDLCMRLRKVGARIASILGETRAYHLWHPPDATMPLRWRDGANVDYLHRRVRMTRCLAGLEPRRVEDLAIRILGARRNEPTVRELAAGFSLADTDATQAELELLVLPDNENFSPHCDCRVAVVPADTELPEAVAQAADVVLRVPRDQPLGGFLADALGKELATPPTRDALPREPQAA